MSQEHAAILAIVVYSAPHGITTRRLMAACGVTRERPSSFFRRLSDLREAGYIFKASHKMAPNRATRAGQHALAAHDNVQ